MEEPSSSQCAIFEQRLSLPDSFIGLNEINCAIWVSSYAPGSTGFFWANTAALQLWGKSSVEEFAKVDIVTDRSDAVAQVHDDLYQHTMSGKVKTGRRTMYPNGKARVLDLEFRPILFCVAATGEEIRGMIVTATEVQMRDEGDMEANRALEMIRHSPTMSMLFDMAGKLIYSNQSANKFYQLDPTTSGASSDSQRSISLRELLETCEFATEEELAGKLAEITALRTGDRQLVLQVKKNTAGDCWTAIQFIPTKDPVSGCDAVLVNESDTTSLVKAQLSLLDVQKAQDNFLAAISHELRTPLNGIIGLSDCLAMDQSCSPKMLKSLRLMRSSGQRLAGLVNDILDAASARHNTLVVRHETVNVADVCEAACDILTPLVKNGVTLVNEVSTKGKVLPKIQGDPGRINQILTNLLSNSIKFTHHGSITLSAEETEDGQHVRIEVSDTGVGIPADKLDSVWGAFQQVDQSTTRKYGGTGLGLALVKDLVEAHNGSVSVRSVHVPEAPHHSTICPDASSPTGTTFTVILPLDQAAHSVTMSPSAPPRKQRPPLGPSSPPSVNPKLAAQGKSVRRKASSMSQGRTRSLESAADSVFEAARPHGGSDKEQPSNPDAALAASLTGDRKSVV